MPLIGPIQSDASRQLQLVGFVHLSILLVLNATRALVRRKPYREVLWGTTSEDAIVDQSASPSLESPSQTVEQSAKLIPNSGDACRSWSFSKRRFPILFRPMVDRTGRPDFETRKADVTRRGWRSQQFLDDRFEVRQ